MRAKSTTGVSRALACGALLAYAATFGALVAVLFRSFGALLEAWVAGIVGAVAGWYVISRRGGARAIAGLVMVVAIVGMVWILLSNRTVWQVLVVVGLLVLATLLASAALDAHRGGPVASRVGTARRPPAHPVLLMNPRSGGGKAERFDLAGEAARRGIEVVQLGGGDDLQQLARDAVARGADVLGMAGGDGSQALVAEVAAEHDVPFVCVPAGTRNHFAADLGVDRDDIVGSLAAFTDGLERRVDIACVNDHVFVNNVSLGVYAAVVQSEAYRDDKLGTVARMLPDLLGPDATPFDLQFDGPDGDPRASADLVLVSNNVYELDRIAPMGSRARLDAGVLGIVVVEVRNAAEVAELVTFQTTGGVTRFRGWRAWSATSFEVRSRAQVDAGVDGEARVLEPPLRFTVVPGALRVRIAPNHPGRSPAATRPRPTVALVRLARLAFRGQAR